jgi:hypothetical protein
VPRPDVTTVAILAAVVLLEGLRKTPAGALVLRRFPWSAWNVALVEGRRPRLRLVSWFPPLSRSVVLSDSGGALGADVRERLGRVRRTVWALEAGGLLALIGLVLGIPVSHASAGTLGLIGSLGVLLLWALGLAATAVLTLMRIGIPRRQALGDGARLLSPFAAPGAAELVLERALAGATPVAVAEALLPPPSFAAWIRPRAYDHVRRGASDVELETLHPRGHWEALVGGAPAGGGSAYCPRCGAWYREAVASCADCDKVSLEPRHQSCPVS